MIAFIANPFNFERDEGRLAAFLLLVALAVLSPNISMPAGLPAVRGEQLMLAALLPSLALYALRHPSARRIGFADLTFAALAVAIIITLAIAPVLVADVGWSLRDPFEVARVVEYWLMFRVGLTVRPAERSFRAAILLIIGLGVLLTVFSLAQYLAGQGAFNDNVTGIWAVAHNLDAAARTGRVVGTIGNANYYGIFSALLMLVPLALILLRYRGSLAAWLVYAAAAAATLSVVMSQSRTAAFALLGAMFLGVLFVAWERRGRAAYPHAIGWFFACAVAAVIFVQAVPPEVGQWSDRFAPSGLAGDTSLGLRLSRWKSIFAGFFEERPSFCEGERLETLPLVKGHEPALSTGATEAAPDALERDEQRRDDVATLTRGVLDYFCDYDRWPAEQPLAEALVPEFLPSLPTDPSTGEPYPAYVARSGFTIGAQLEDPSDPAGPLYTLGTIPNFALNPSFETANGTFDRWSTNGDASASVTTSGLFGRRSASVTIPPGGNLYQTLALDLNLGESYTAAAWLRSSSGEAETVQVYLTATLQDGSSLDPLASETFEIAPGDAWTRVQLPFETPENKRITVLQLLVRAGGDSTADLQIDGLTLTQGAVLPSFVTVRDIDPSSLSRDLPGFSDSPIIGAGPRKDIELGTVDNEYLLMLDRYGLLGFAAYLAFFFAAFRIAWRAWRNDASYVSALALAMMVFIVAMGAFNVTAGSFYHFQLMAVTWLLLGLLAASTHSTANLEDA